MNLLLQSTFPRIDLSPILDKLFLLQSKISSAALELYRVVIISRMTDLSLLETLRTVINECIYLFKKIKLMDPPAFSNEQAQHCYEQEIKLLVKNKILYCKSKINNSFTRYIRNIGRLVHTFQLNIEYQRTVRRNRRRRSFGAVSVKKLKKWNISSRHKYQPKTEKIWIQEVLTPSQADTWFYASNQLSCHSTQRPKL